MAKSCKKLDEPILIPTNGKSIRLTKWRKLDIGELETEAYFGKPIDSTLPQYFDKYPSNQRKQTTCTKYAGILFGLLAAISFSASALSSKLLVGRKYHVFNIGLYRYQGMTILGPLMLLYFTLIRKIPVFDAIWPPTKPKLRIIFILVLRSSFGVGTMLFQIQALKYLSLADTSLITFSTPIAVAFFARIFLHEPCRILSIILGVTTFGGICILARPPIITGGTEFDMNILIGISYAFTAMLFLSSVFVVIRLIKETHFSLFICFYGYLGSIETLMLAYYFDVLELPRSTYDSMIFAGGAALSLAGQIFLIMALKADFAGLVALVRTGDVVFAFIWQIILGSIPDEFSFIGAITIVTCILMTGVIKWLSSLPNDHIWRVKCWFLLK